MAIPVEMPKMSDTMEEGLLVSWLVEEGARVSSGDILAQVETDKATMDLEVYDDGVLLKRLVEEGESIPIGGLIAVLGKAGEDISELLSKYGSAEKKPAGDAAKSVESEEVSASQAPASLEAEDGSRIKISPLAKRIAQDQGVSLASLQGSGPEGRIIKRDVESASGKKIETAARPASAGPASAGPASAGPAPAPRPASTPARPAPVPVSAGGHKSIKITPMRKTIARRLAASKFTSPHFYLQKEVDMERTIAFRAGLNQKAEAMGYSKISFNDIVTKACAVSLRLHPDVNASYLEEEGEIRIHNDVHIAVAVAIDEGLVTPVVRNPDQKGLAAIAEETKDLAIRARERTLEPPDWEGSTFTTSNLGMFGIERFTAIINPPNAAILAIGAIRDVPVVKNGTVVPGKRMTLSLSCDHRVVDGAVGSRFLNTVCELLEDPGKMLL